MIAAKANSARSFLQQNLSKCPPSVKSSCYTTLVYPIIEYTCTVWSPHHQQNVLKLEIVQWQAARFVSNNYNRIASVTEMLHHLKWDTLEARRNNLRVILLYKIFNKLVNISPEKQLVLTNITRGHSQNTFSYQPKLMPINIPFFPASTRIWNSLPLYIVNADTLDLFKTGLNM